MIDDILLMVKLVKSGSFVNAAKELGVAQSTISRRIDLLEKKLGVKLVKRDPRNIGLTDKGSILYENFKDSFFKFAIKRVLLTY
jgi:DNA-binding transcriptional LysR family regulator